MGERVAPPCRPWWVVCRCSSEVNLDREELKNNRSGYQEDKGPLGRTQYSLYVHLLLFLRCAAQRNAGMEGCHSPFALTHVLNWVTSHLGMWQLPRPEPHELTNNMCLAPLGVGRLLLRATRAQRIAEAGVYYKAWERLHILPKVPYGHIRSTLSQRLPGRSSGENRSPICPGLSSTSRWFSLCCCHSTICLR